MSVVSIGVLVIIAFLFLWVFPDSSYLTYGLGSFDLYFQFLSYLLLFIVPVFSVSLLSAEYQYGTEVLLKSLSLDWKDIIISKFLSAIIILSFVLVFLSVHLFVVSDISFSSTSNLSQIISGFGGLLGVGACYTALSLMVASFTEQNTPAILLSVIICFIFYSGFTILSGLPLFEGSWDLLLDRLSLSYHTDQIGRGILRLSTLIYFPFIIIWALWISSVKLNAKQV